MFYKLIFWVLFALMAASLGAAVFSNFQHVWMVEEPIVSQEAGQSLFLIGSGLLALTLLVQKKCREIACKKEVQ